MNDLQTKFKSITIDKSLHIPVYYQIKTGIHNLIAEKSLKPGDKILTEEELCDIFNVSRMTIRQALNELVNSGELKREKGKGTFVTSNKILFDISRLHSFSEDMKYRGLTVSNKILEKKIISSNIEVYKALHITEKDKVLKLKRLRIIDNEPIAIETSYISMARCSGIENEDFLTDSLFRIFEEKYRLKLYYSEQTLEPIIAAKKEVNLLNIKNRTPLIKMTGITFLVDKSPLEYVIGLYRGDRYKFRLYPRR